MSVIVIGAGVAGAAAVFAAVTRGRPCVWIHRGVGASATSSGALDWDPVGSSVEVPWASDSQPVALNPELERFGREVFGWQLPSQGVRVATPLGQVRAARGADLGVLNLDSLGQGELAVLDPGKAGWDAERICAALNQSEWITAKKLHAVPLKLADVGVVPDAPDVLFARGLNAAQNFVPELVSALGRLREQRAVSAVLAGPWLFPDNASALALRSVFAEFGVALGETLSPPYGIAGQRFEAVRTQFGAEHAELEMVAARATRVERIVTGYRVDVTQPQAATAVRTHWLAESCVLALGGVSSGALQLDTGHRLRLGLDLEPPEPWIHRGRPWLQPASQTGLDLIAFGMDALLELGLPRAMHRGALRAVGDLVADEPRSVLRAAQSGLDAFS
jgi:hypothetical protein